MISLFKIIIAALVVFTISYILVAAIRSWANRRRILDIPNERSSHNVPVPRGGGISIVVLVILGIWFFYIIDPALYQVRILIAFTAGGILISGISIFDDLYTVRNNIRFLVHGMSAVIIVVVVGYASELILPFINNIQLGVIGIILTFLYITGLTNAYNFMDGIDGIAGIQAIVAGAGWACIGYLYSDPILLLTGILVASASAGFLLHNWHPAKIFMGDVGSAFLGYTFAVLTVIALRRDPVLLIIGVMFVWPFIFDTAYTIAKRLIRRENIFQAHRSHVYQRLVIAGWKHSSVSLLYGIFASIVLIPVILINKQYSFGLPLLVTLPVLCCGILILLNSKVEKKRQPG